MLLINISLQYYDIIHVFVFHILAESSWLANLQCFHILRWRLFYSEWGRMFWGLSPTSGARGQGRKL
jgi:hypothetical protein